MKTKTPIKHGLNPMQLRTNRTNKLGARKDGGGNKNARRTTFASVDCAIHGSERALTRKKEVYMSRGRNKREIYGGCPQCAAARRSGKL